MIALFTAASQQMHTLTSNMHHKIEFYHFIRRIMVSTLHFLSLTYSNAKFSIVPVYSKMDTNFYAPAFLIKQNVQLILVMALKIYPTDQISTR